jgi:hypothetical protein
METMATDPVSTKPLCRLCTINPREAIHGCQKCRQKFCAPHLKEHVNLFQENDALLGSACNSYFSCNSKKIQLIDQLIENVSPDLLLSFISNLATTSLEVLIFPTKIPLKLDTYAIRMSKARNITELSIRIKRNFILFRSRA